MTSNYSVTSSQQDPSICYALCPSQYFLETVFSFHICQSSDTDFKGTLPERLLSFHNFLLLSHHAWSVHKYQQTFTFRNNNKHLISSNTRIHRSNTFQNFNLALGNRESPIHTVTRLPGHTNFWTVAKNKAATTEWKFLFDRKFHKVINQ